LPGHLTKGKPARKSAATTLTEGTGTDGAIVNAIGASLYHHGTVVNQDANAGHLMVEQDVVGALAARDYKGVGNQYVAENKLVTEPYVKSSRAQTSEDSETWIPSEVNPTLNSFDQGDVRATTAIVEPVLIDGQRVGDVRIYSEPVQTLGARMGTGGNNVPMLAFDTQFGSNANVTEDVAPTLKSSQAPPSVAYGITGNAIGRQDHNGPNGPSHTPEGGPMFTLTGTDIHAVALTMAVRRLTPLECERLMGWPDDHTRWKADGTEQADTHRYKQCGNGVASPVAQWIGKHLIKLGQQ
jgi:site-specific DNA-cytosine methylase